MELPCCHYKYFPLQRWWVFFQLLLFKHNGRVFNCSNSFYFGIIGCGCNIFDFKNDTLLSQDTIFYDYNSKHLDTTFTLFQTPFTLFHEFWKFKSVLNKDKSIIPPSAANKGRSTVNHQPFHSQQSIIWPLTTHIYHLMII